MVRVERIAVVLLCLAAGACTQQSSTSTSSPSSSASVTEAGWSFGFCLGPCLGRLDLQGDQLIYEVSDRTGDQVFASNRGQLTSRGATRLESLASNLSTPLQETYGCPDCADGGASFIVIVRAGESRRTEYEYGNPPEELSAIDGFLTGLMDALGRCRAAPEVILAESCTPVPD